MSRRERERDRDRRALQASARTDEYFVPKDGIDREVITADICRYLGNDALVRPGNYENPQTRQIQQGYFITAYRNLTTAMIADIKADSERWEAERRAHASRGQPFNVDYRASTIHHSRQYYGPTSEAASAVSLGGYQQPAPTSSGQVYDSSVPGGYAQPNYAQPSSGYQQQTPADPYYQSVSSDMRTTPIKPSLLPSQKLVPRPTPTLRRRINRVKKHLPILLNSKHLNACADSGATYNMISRVLAQDLGSPLFVDDQICLFELPIAGEFVKSVGKTSMSWHFPDEEDLGKTCEFFVFEELITPLIMGRNFLRLTNTLEKYKHRLQDRPLDVHPTIPIVRWSGISQESFPCYLDDTLTNSSPDTGAEVNVISKTFALKITPFIDRTVAGQVQFANGMIQSTLGRIRAKVTFGHDPDYYIEAKFEVIDNLRVDVILGDEILFGMDVYTQYTHLFRHTRVDADYSELGTIAWLGIGEKIIYDSTAKVKKFITRGKKALDEVSAAKILDDRDLQEQDRIEREVLRISQLQGAQKAAAEAQEQISQQRYIANRVRFQFGNPDPV